MSIITRARSGFAVACLCALVPSVAACGSDPPSAAASKSFEEALGLDQASMNARQAKVQEAVRACMKAQGFDYVPVDPSQGGPVVQFGVGGPGGGGGDSRDRRTKGYGISTGLLAQRPRANQDQDPNQRIRDALSDADKKAYDEALFGEAATKGGTDGEGGGFAIRVGPDEGQGPATGPSNAGCFGKAEKEVPGGPAALGSSLKDLMERIASDPRLIAANQKWAACLAKAGYDKFEKRDDIVKYLIDKMASLSGGGSNGGGNVTIGSPDDIDQAALAALQREELSIARADDDCAKQTRSDKVEATVRKEAQQRFLDEHPDLVVGK